MMERRYPGEIIKVLRESKKMSQNKLAVDADSDIATISRLESGKQGYNSKTLERIADVLGCELYEFFQVHKYGLVNNDGNVLPLRRRRDFDRQFAKAVDLLERIYDAGEPETIPRIITIMENFLPLIRKKKIPAK